MGGPGSGRKKGSGGYNPKTGLPGVSKSIKKGTKNAMKKYSKNYSQAFKMHEAIKKAK